MGKRRIWKSWYIARYDTLRDIQAAWQNSTGAFGTGKIVSFGQGWIETNLSLRDMRSLARFAGVRLPVDYVTDTKPSWDDEAE